MGGSEAGCKTLADLWPRWLIVYIGLVGVSLALGICQEFNFMQMVIGRKCSDAGTCKPRQNARARVKLRLLESSSLDVPQSGTSACFRVKGLVAPVVSGVFAGDVN